jgi:hypothetical protein
MKSLLDPSFRYVPANETDLRKTFARERRRLRSEQRERPPTIGNVMPMAPRRKTTTS